MNTTQIVHQVQSVLIAHVDSDEAKWIEIKLIGAHNQSSLFSMFADTPEQMAALRILMPEVTEDDAGRALMEGAEYTDYVVEADCSAETDPYMLGDKTHHTYDVELTEVTLHGHDVLELLSPVDKDALEQMAMEKHLAVEDDRGNEP